MENLRVLVVDDDDMIRLAVTQVLRRDGCLCSQAADGLEALEALQDQDFEVLLTDLSMPRMDGLTLLKAAQKVRPHIVTIVLSGMGSRDDVKAALQQGAFDFLDKPIPEIAVLSLAVKRAGDRSLLTRQRDQLLADLRHKNTELEVSLQQLKDAYARLQYQECILESDLQQAQRIHNRLLPAEFPHIPGLDFFGYYSPCERMGGDFFGVVPLPDEKVALYLADVAGHGVGAAMVTVVIRELIHAHLMLHPDSDVFHHPPSALEFIHKGLLEEQFDPPILVTMAYAVVDSRAGHVTAGCAGHPPPILVTGPGKTTFLPAHGPVLGINVPAQYIMARFDLNPGDLIVLYSDGLSEARNLAGEEIGEWRLAREISRSHGQAAWKVGQALEKTLRDYQQHASPEDDETFLVIRRCPFGGGEETVGHPLEPLHPQVHIVEHTIHACPTLFPHPIEKQETESPASPE
jgi:serine phosphatase RsbU (regulator of sigma subunit)